MAKNIYDLECGPNYFLIGALDVDSLVQSIFTFYIDDHDIVGISLYQNECKPYEQNHFKRMGLNPTPIDTINANFRIKDEFLLYLKNLMGSWLIGFNNYHYDDIMLHYFMHRFFNVYLKELKGLGYKAQAPENVGALRDFLMDLHILSQQIINGTYIRNGYPALKSIDLKKVARTQKSLKQMGGSLAYETIQDFPVDFNKKLSWVEINDLTTYLRKDLAITYYMYMNMKDSFELRKNISLKYNLNVMGLDNTGMGSTIFEKFYEDFTRRPLPRFQLKAYQHPESIQISSILFPFVNNIKQEPLASYLKSIQNKIIHMNKISDEETASLKGLLPELIINGKEYTLGVGGLHSVDPPATLVSTDKFLYIDSDVASYYPRLIISYKLHPPQLGEEFWKLIDKMTNERLAAKKKGDMVTSDALKIAILSVFGKTNEKTSWFYSPETFLRITINGQIALLYLISKLEEKGFEVVSANTDGIVTKVENNRHTEYKEICAEWEKEVMVSLEFTEYSLYARRNVNNYIAITTSGKIKQKGEFVTLVDLTKDCNPMIIPMAVERYFYHKYFLIQPFDVRTFIQSNQNKNLFLFTKKPASSDYENLIISPQGNRMFINKTVRFIVVKKSFPKRFLLMKEKTAGKRKGSKTSYLADKYIALCNDVNYMPSSTEIDYNYYIHEAENLIQIMENRKQSLNLFE